MSKIISIEKHRRKSAAARDKNELREWARARVLDFRERETSNRDLREDAEALAGIAFIALALWAILILLF